VRSALPPGINADGTGDTPVLTTKQIYTHPILQPTS
jgi:hypothetical protein